MEHADRRNGAPLSFPQERLWALSRLNPGGDEFNVPYAFRVLGELDVGALSAALSEVIRRHEILRTVFEQKNGQAVQAVRPAGRISVPVVDLTDYGEDGRELKAASLMNEHARRPFDLSEGPLVRTELLKLSAEEHIFLITFHHIIYDAWSDGLFFRELDELYGGGLAGRPSALEELTHQYADYAAWQREWIKSECLDELRAYWRRQLDGISSQNLPTDYPRPVKPSGVLRRKVRVIDDRLRDELRHLANDEGMTDFIVLLAAFNVLLHTYLARDDVYVCIPIANRGRSEVQKMIGYFVNFVIYRTSTSGDITFRELMARVCTVSSGAYGHQELPIQELINRLDLLNLPLSQVIFSVQNVVRRTPSLGGLRVTPMEEQRRVDFDVFLEIEHIEEGLTINLRYRADLFAEETMEHLVEDYERILKAIAADADHPVGALLELEPEQREAWRSRRELLEMREAQRLAATNDHVPPRDELERQLVTIWRDLLEREAVGVTDNFFVLGGKSLNAIQMILEIEKKTGKELPVSILAEAQTIEQIAALMRNDSIRPSSASVVALQARGSNPPLFVLQPAASTPLHFANLARYMAPDQPVYGFEQRGMDGIEGPHQSVEEMARFHVREMKMIAPKGPYLLLGRCMGGIVAYEMALQLQAEGEEVAFLGILDTQSPPRLEPRDARYYVTEAVKRVIHYTRQGELLNATVGRYLQKSRRRRSDSESEKILQKVMDTHERARKRYIPAKLFEGTLLVFKNKKGSLDAQQQWSRLATGGLEYLESNGDHKTMLEEPYIHEFVKKLTAAIDVCLGRGVGDDSKRKAA
ncbi:MAG: hypothetical protein HYR49_06740 [Gammaproteobacteria bacterium]|nr:hypothetical protein [Gammaproteobacteria bacterium]